MLRARWILFRTCFTQAAQPRSHAKAEGKTRSTASTATKKMEPTAPPEKACTESSTPLLVRKVPKMVREKERTISAQHHHLRAGIPVLGSSVWSSNQ